MNIVIFDGYTINPGDLSWDKIDALCDIYGSICREPICNPFFFVLPNLFDFLLNVIYTGQDGKLCLLTNNPRQVPSNLRFFQ